MRVHVSRYFEDSRGNEPLADYEDVHCVFTGPKSEGLAWFGESLAGDFDLAICVGFTLHLDSGGDLHILEDE